MDRLNTYEIREYNCLCKFARNIVQLDPGMYKYQVKIKDTDYYAKMSSNLGFIELCRFDSDVCIRIGIFSISELKQKIMENFATLIDALNFSCTIFSDDNRITVTTEDTSLENQLYYFYKSGTIRVCRNTIREYRKVLLRLVEYTHIVSLKNIKKISLQNNGWIFNCNYNIVANVTINKNTFDVKIKTFLDESFIHGYCSDLYNIDTLITYMDNVKYRYNEKTKNNKIFDTYKEYYVYLEKQKHKKIYNLCLEQIVQKQNFTNLLTELKNYHKNKKEQTVQKQNFTNLLTELNNYHKNKKERTMQKQKHELQDSINIQETLNSLSNSTKKIFVQMYTLPEWRFKAEYFNKLSQREIDVTLALYTMDLETRTIILLENAIFD